MKHHRLDFLTNNILVAAQLEGVILYLRKEELDLSDIIKRLYPAIQKSIS